MHATGFGVYCGRETIRRHLLTETEANYLLFLDADMTFEPAVVEKMKGQMRGCQVVFSGSPMRHGRAGLAGAGCLMATRSILEKLRFRCFEFRNGQVITEDNMLEIDLFELRETARKGFFASVRHYTSPTEFKDLASRPVSIAKRIANWYLARYWLLKFSLIVRYNILWNLKLLVDRLPPGSS